MEQRGAAHRWTRAYAPNHGEMVGWALGLECPLHKGSEICLGTILRQQCSVRDVQTAIVEHTEWVVWVAGDACPYPEQSGVGPERFLPLLQHQKEVVGTGMLVLCILAVVDGRNIGAPRGVEPLAVGLILLGISVSMGLNCGYPLNPARDLGPRLFTAAAGWGMEVFSTADYWWWIPVAGPLVGGVAGAVIYFLLIELHHTNHSDKPHEEPEEEEEEDEDEDEDSSLKDKYEMINMS
ncbi:hypothetical protein cypCar_00034705 [Cyprinus carpio]|nr:hypothetical protein cypCar_00034705 [Cyprinus carpio]